MGGTDRLPLSAAIKLSHDLLGLLRPACERIEVAGSIRRGSPTIGDVELVCIPRMEQEQAASTDLFAQAVTVTYSALERLCQRLLDEGVFSKRVGPEGGMAWGEANKWGVYKGFAVDIYTATPETWGVTFAIRTGPAEFSKRLVMERRHGGLCPSYLQFKGWRVRNRQDGQPLETPEEADVFRVLGLEPLPPERRTDQAQPQRLSEKGAF